MHKQIDHQPVVYRALQMTFGERRAMSVFIDIFERSPTDFEALRVLADLVQRRLDTEELARRRLRNR